MGRYEIRRELGRGAMGVVYEAFDPALGRTIALKTILPEVAREEREAFEERFFTEARIAARLTHPGIVVVHDVGRDAATGTLYIALEYLQGRTLADTSNEGPQGWAEAFTLGAQVARGLHHAHLLGIVQIRPGVERHRAVAAQQLTHRCTRVGCLQGLAQVGHRDAGTGHALRIELHQRRTTGAAEGDHFSCAGDALEVDLQAVRHALQVLRPDGGIR